VPLCRVPLRQLPGVGTIANIVVIGLVADAADQVLPEPPRQSRGNWLARLAG
jgi:hypothetical protein